MNVVCLCVWFVFVFVFMFYVNTSVFYVRETIGQAVEGIKSRNESQRFVD